MEGTMKKVLIVIGIIVIAAGAFIFLSPKTDDKPDSTPSTRFAAIQKDVKSGAYLIDVRTPEEYAAGHFVSAINFDSTKVDAGQMPDIAKDAKIYLYCRSGRRAGEVLTAMKKAGFTEVSSLGGLTEVQSLGGTLVQ